VRKKKVKVKNVFFEKFAVEAQKLQQKQLPMVLAFWITRNFDKISKEAEPYFTMKRKLAEKYSMRDEKGGFKIDAQGNYQIENISKFIEELRELQEQEIEMELDVVKVKLKDLKKIKVEITPAEMSCLTLFLEIEE